MPPDLARFFLVDMFLSVTDSEHKNTILQLFTQESQLRTVIATGLTAETFVKLFMLGSLMTLNLMYRRLEELGGMENPLLLYCYVLNKVHMQVKK